MEEADARAAWMFDGINRCPSYVAELNGTIVGTAYLKPNQIALGDQVANAGWMISPASSGRGIGRRFARYVLDEARRLGFHAMQFNAVVATNERAVSLGESLGSRVVGTIPGGFRHVTYGLTSVHIMYVEL